MVNPELVSTFEMAIRDAHGDVTRLRELSDMLKELIFYVEYLKTKEELNN